MPDLTGSGRGAALVPNSEYFLELINGAAAAAEEAGYALVVVPSGADAGFMHSFGVDGMVIVDPKGSESALQDSTRTAYPIVTTGQPIVTGARRNLVIDNDHFAAAWEVLDHFGRQGYSQPAIVIDATSRSYIHDIVRAYTAWCARRSVRPAVFTIDDLNGDSVRECVRTLRDCEPPADAVYVCREDFAVAVVDAARQLGVAVPRDMGLASAVDSSILRVSSPSITGVALNPNEIGVQAVQSLTALIDPAHGDELQSRSCPVPSELMVRETSTRPGV